MRLKKIINTLRKNQRLPYLVTDLNNIRYLTGFTGSYAYLVIDEKKSYFISDSRYEEYAKSILPESVDFTLLDESFFFILKRVLKETGNRLLYLEEHALTLSTYLELKQVLRGIKLIPAGDEVNSQRMVKDESEIDILRRAAVLTDKCVDHLIKFVKPGMLEWDIAVEVEYFYRKNGCRKTSFDTIVASGKGTSMPHYETSMTKKVEKGDILLVDMGCEFEGYNSDLTRTMFVSKIDPAMVKIYSIVKKAQETAVDAIKSGITTGKLDRIARDIISKEGYGSCFGHSLGHGFGIEVHELPALRSGGDLKLKKNMTVTVEPGIYVPGLGGVRIEDMVLVTSKGHEVLTKSKRDMIII